jgi:cation diffusion facilitator CzcD-associated flavoprotein CzcO
MSSIALEADRGVVEPPGSGTCDVAIVGAGPYGLGAAARLRSLGDLDVKVFGEPMSFWAGMPEGMLLRSAWDACHIGFPDGELTLDAYRAWSKGDFGSPVPLDAFIDYGRWFQRSAVPDVDARRVEYVERGPDGFTLEIAGGDVLRADRVVLAAGIEAFPSRPSVFASLPDDVVTHSSEHRDLARLAGRRVLVVGGGQSALESAALLHEAGAEVEVVARNDQIIWLRGGTVQRRLGRLKPLLYARTDVGPAGLSRVVAMTRLFRRLPRPMQDKMARRAIRPAGARWLVDRLAEVPITTARRVVGARTIGERITIDLDDGSHRRADHVILGTGYRVEVRAYDFLAPALRDDLRCAGGYPLLGPGLESSIPGLHFLGAPAAFSFGPTMRFVSGSWFAARQLTAHLRRSRHAG